MILGWWPHWGTAAARDCRPIPGCYPSLFVQKRDRIARGYGSPASLSSTLGQRIESGGLFHHCPSLLTCNGCRMMNWHFGVEAVEVIKSSSMACTVLSGHISMVF
jgi:hypothetical protein